MNSPPLVVLVLALRWRSKYQRTTTAHLLCLKLKTQSGKELLFVVNKIHFSVQSVLDPRKTFYPFAVNRCQAVTAGVLLFSQGFFSSLTIDVLLDFFYDSELVS